MTTRGRKPTTLEQLAELGAQRKELLARLENEIKPKLHELIRAAVAEGATQQRVMELTGYSRSQAINIIRERGNPYR